MEHLTEELGLMLFGGVDLDVTLVQLQKKQCSNCGRPASMAIRELETQERQFLCAGCRPRPFR
jgi:hypothetical protein